MNNETFGPTDFESYTFGFDPSAFLHGKAFLDASKAIEGIYHQSHARYAMQAFSIEVFLKSMQMKIHVKQVYSPIKEPNSFGIDSEKSFTQWTPPNGGHDVSNVYQNLDEQLRVSLSSAYQIKYSRNLAEDLADIGDLFVRLRYLYEGTSVSYAPDILGNVADFLVEFIHREQRSGLFDRESWSKKV